MKVVDAVAHLLKAEGVEFLFAYPVNHLIEAAAKVDIRTIIVRQERIGLHMADAVSRVTPKDFRLPLKPRAPAEDQARTFPDTSVIVTLVLLKVD